MSTVFTSKAAFSDVFQTARWSDAQKLERGHMTFRTWDRLNTYRFFFLSDKTVEMKKKQQDTHVLCCSCDDMKAVVGGFDVNTLED